MAGRLRLILTEQESRTPREMSCLTRETLQYRVTRAQESERLKSTCSAGLRQPSTFCAAFAHHHRSSDAANRRLCACTAVDTERTPHRMRSVPPRKRRHFYFGLACAADGRRPIADSKPQTSPIASQT